VSNKYNPKWDRNLPRDMLYQLSVYAVSGIGNNSATILYPAMNGLSIKQEMKKSSSDLGCGGQVMRCFF